MVNSSIIHDNICSLKVGIPKTITEPKTTTMYHMHSFVASICMDLVHSGGIKFGDGFGYSYLIHKCHPKGHHSDIKYHMTLNSIFGVNMRVYVIK